MNKDITKYFNECKYLFCSFGKKEKEYLKKAKEHHRKHNCFDVGTAGESISKLIIEYIEEKR